MNRLGAGTTGVLISLALAGSPALAAKAHKVRPAAAASACCTLMAGTQVQVELADEVTTKVQKSGDMIVLKLAAPVIVDGRVVMRAGTPGVGQVVEASKPGMGGKAGRLILAARYLTVGRTQVPLQGLQLTAAGDDKSKEAQAIGLTGIAFAPLGFLGLAVHGSDVSLAAGAVASAKVSQTVQLPSLALATRKDIADAKAAADLTAAAPSDVPGLIAVPSPPAGKGQVVFFRGKSLLGTGQWFNVRENKVALGKLTNGAYFIQVTDPGVHTYTASLEPELKDQLKLEVDPGETYFIEGTLTKGVVVGAANLSPSDKATFDKDSAELKPADAMTDKDAAEPGVASDSGAPASGAPMSATPADASAAGAEMNNASAPPKP